MKPTPSKKISNLPPYIFVYLHTLKLKAEAKGLNVIDMGMGSPDLPSPENVINALKAAVDEPWTHRYPTSAGLPALKKAIAGWYKRRFDVNLDPNTEVLPLIGSKEGIAHLFMALCEPGQKILVPNPCYPVHYFGVLISGAKPVLMPLKEENGFLPELGKIRKADARAAKIMVLNYPNNPTGAVLPDDSLLKEALAFSKKYGTLIAYDNAYSEISFDGYRAPSILQLPGAIKHAVEFNSCSKTYSMAGWRIGFVVGNAEAIGYLAKFKGFLDYGVPSFIQQAAAEALTGPQDYIQGICETYKRRRDTLVRALASVGWEVPVPRAAMYIWAPLPVAAGKMPSLKFAERLLLEHGVVLTPGTAFGPCGEGYIRMSLVVPEEKLEEAARRIGEFLRKISGKNTKPAGRSLASARS